MFCPFLCVYSFFFFFNPVLFLKSKVFGLLLRPAPLPHCSLRLWQIWVRRQRSPWASCSGPGSSSWRFCSCCWPWTSHVTLSTSVASSCASAASLAPAPKDTTWRRGRRRSCEPQCQTNTSHTLCSLAAIFVLITTQTWDLFFFNLQTVKKSSSDSWKGNF